jgi:hypothetical protein
MTERYTTDTETWSYTSEEIVYLKGRAVNQVIQVTDYYTEDNDWMTEKEYRGNSEKVIGHEDLMPWDEYLETNLGLSCDWLIGHENVHCKLSCLVLEDNPVFSQGECKLACSLIDSSLYSLESTSIVLTHKRVLDGSKSTKKLRSIWDCECPYCTIRTIENTYKYSPHEIRTFNYTGQMMLMDFSSH